MKKFGGKGEGPGEFYIPTELAHQKEKGLQISLRPDYLMVNSSGKLLFFSRNGDYKRMIKFKSFGFAYDFVPLGKNFIAWGSADRKSKAEYKNAVSLFQPDIHKIKEIYTCDFPFKMSGRDAEKAYFFKLDTPIYETYDNKIFITFSGIQKFEIEVFNETGEKLYTVSTDYEKIKLTDEHIKKYKSEFKYLFKFGLEWNLKNTLFPEYFPAIRNFSIADDKIYVLTFKKEGNKSEFIIFDLKGKLLKKIMFPVVEMNAKHFSPYSIADGKFYQIIENEDETWELHVTPIN